MKYQIQIVVLHLVKVDMKIRYVLLGVMILVVVWFSTNHIKGVRNMNNSNKVEIGMTKNEFIEIMGEPELKRLSYFDKSDSSYHYKTPFASATGIVIVFDETNKVVFVEDDRFE